MERGDESGPKTGSENPRPTDTGIIPGRPGQGGTKAPSTSYPTPFGEPRPGTHPTQSPHGDPRGGSRKG